MSATNNGNSNGELIQYPLHDFETAEKERLKVWAFPEDPYQSERDAIAILRRGGVYAVPGRWSEWKYTDIVAFGFVRIESRHSNVKIHSGKEVFHWRVKSPRHDKGIRGEIVMLTADFGDRVETALFPSTHEIFYRKNGELKKGMSYRPDKVIETWHERRYGLSLNSDIWYDHVDNFGLVWDVLYENAKKLG